MEALRIKGPTQLMGTVEVQGSKNAVLPMMAAAVINASRTKICNCPDISDVYDSCDILRLVGCKVEFVGNTLTIDSSYPITPVIPEEFMTKIRASFIFTGALLARCGKFCVSHPGGCKIGLRPVDIHLEALRRLGAGVELTSDEIRCNARKITPCDVTLRFPSVGATENIMILASTLEGTTRIINAAREPEIADLQNMLNAMGAHITGAGSSVVTIKGTKNLKSVEHSVMPDRIDTATYLSAVCCTGGKILITGADASHLSGYINLLKRCGASIEVTAEGILAEKTERLRGGARISTAPYPGFATDIQSLAMAVLCLTDGVSLIRENIFENRFCVSSSLCNMGADIRIYRSTASVRGVRTLMCANECACDLRSGAALALAMFASEGESQLSNIHYIDRGYEKFEQKYKALGADIERVWI